MSTEQYFGYIYFAVFSLLVFGIVGTLIFTERLGLTKLLGFWAAAIALLGCACALVMLKSCPCSLAQVLTLACPTCLLGTPKNGVLTSEALVFSLTVLVPVAAVLSVRRSLRRR